MCFLLISCLFDEKPSTPGIGLPPQTKDSLYIDESLMDSLKDFSLDSAVVEAILKVNSINPENLKQYMTLRSNRTVELKLNGLQLKTLPHYIARMKYLQRLQITRGNLKYVSDSLGSLIYLLEIDFSSNFLDSVPPSIGKLKNLTSLNLSKNHLKTLPAFVGDLPELTTLRLSDNPIGDSIPPIVKFPKLRTLDLSNLGLSRIPKTIMGISTLDTLYLVNNQIDSIEASSNDWLVLKFLNLSGNRLKSLPNDIWSILSLQTLVLSNNQLTQIPEISKELRSIRVLDFSKNAISTSKYLGPYSNLEVFDLSGNRFEFLHFSITENKKLNHLYLNDNKLLQLPYGLENLEALTVLNIKNNDIITIPPPLVNLSTLKQISIDGNEKFCWTEKLVGTYLNTRSDVPIDSCPPLDGFFRPYTSLSKVSGLFFLETEDPVTRLYTQKPLVGAPVILFDLNFKRLDDSTQKTNNLGEYSLPVKFGSYRMATYHYTDSTILPYSKCSEVISIVNLNDTIRLAPFYIGDKWKTNCSAQIPYPTQTFKINTPIIKDSLMSIQHVVFQPPPKPKKQIQLPYYIMNKACFMPSESEIDTSFTIGSTQYFFDGAVYKYMARKGIETSRQFIYTYNLFAQDIQCLLPHNPIGDKEDNDYDGCIDEEIWDNLDNDGDGVIDEDVRKGTYKNVTFQNLFNPIILGGDSIELSSDKKIKQLIDEKVWLSNSQTLEPRDKLRVLNISNIGPYPNHLDTAKKYVGGCWSLYGKILGFK